MATFVIDTLKFQSILQKRGFSEEQAFGITDALQTVDLQNVASKEDIIRLDAKISVMVAEVKSDIMRWMFGGFFSMMLMMIGLFFKISTLAG